ncbi:TPA: hypothetical protein ACKLO9_001558 [Neisseria gonorrhoeae]
MPADLPTTLRHLANHLHHLQTEIWENRYHAARTSQTGVRHTTTGPSSPTNDTQLDYLLDTQTRLRELATNASEDLHILIPHNTQVGDYWAAWLHRHRTQLQDLTWYEDLETELQDLEAELRHHIHPQAPHTVKLPDYATADEIGRALGKTPDAIRKWCKRHHVTAYIENGKTKYRTKEITDT